MRRNASLLSFVATITLWQLLVLVLRVPPYVVPAPSGIVRAFLSDAPTLLASLLSTLAVTLAALICAVILGVALATSMAFSRWAKAVLAPWTIILQVTPIVAIAPLIIVWIDNPFVAMVVCATVVAFFPIFSNTSAGLAATSNELVDLFRLSGASSWQQLALLRLPASLPYFLAGLRISGGLALVGAVVAEFVTGAGGLASGLAFRILEAGYRLQIARMFAALGLLSAAGLAINTATAALSRFVLSRRS